METIARQEALEQGLKRYYTGKPCKHGHDSERRVCDHTCCRCGRLKAGRQRRKNKEQKNEKWRRQVDAQIRSKNKLRASCPIRRAMHSMRTRMGNACGSKSAHTWELLGCSPLELQIWLEERFAPGMTWENRPDWHIDHIRPCASFDLTDPEQQRQCFHYTNLQPLWAEVNCSKGDTYGGPA